MPEVALVLAAGTLELLGEGDASIWVGLALGVAVATFPLVGKGDGGVSARLALGLGTGCPMRSVARSASLNLGERRGFAIKKGTPTPIKTDKITQSLIDCLWLDLGGTGCAESPEGWEYPDVAWGSIEPVLRVVGWG